MAGRSGQESRLLHSTQHRGRLGLSCQWETVTVSDDLKRIAWVSEMDGKYRAVIDGKTGDEYDKVFRPVFGIYGNRVTYICEKKPYRGADSNDRYAVFNGKERRIRYERTYYISPDAKRIAYIFMD